ncbi:hypothetical protein Pve01_13980 [Planomonospora venezuelensis]|nr:hypothetical protein Pve01_13980 [Planomonospora venezuelensis]
MLALTACSSLLPPSEPVRGQATAGGVVGAFGGQSGDRGGDQGGDPTGAAPSSTASATPSPAALAPEDYRAELEQARGPVREALKKLAGTGGKSLDRRVKGVAAAVDDAVARLEPLAPPAELAAQHGNYVGALRSFGTAFDGALQDVQTQQACTGPAVLTGLEKQGELTRMDEAAAAMSGYPADVVPVKAAGQRNRRLPNGRIIRSESRTGRGSLKIHNGGKRDAVIVMLRGGKRVVTVYVRGKSKATISGVRDGKYKVFYTTGTDWDSRAFTRSCEFTQFGKTVPFKTTYSGAYVRWNNWTITLHSVKGGTVRSKPLKPDDFPG